ncbi:unnamed protein product [Heterobilharzia americana]|nr:unnamed protein product [Heterobilharzia americana]
MFSLTGVEISLLRCAFLVKSMFSLLIIISSVFPDHDADAFKPPQEPYLGWADKVIRVCFQGFCKWDSVYFTFIAEHGYIYEQSLAFFPGFPMLSGLLGRILTLVCLNSLSLASAVLLCGFLLNFVLCLLATICFYRLGVSVLGSSKISFLSALLFCWNPAVVFFSSLYSESLFFFLTVFGLYLLTVNRTLWSSLLFASSISCRSNGLLNIGYLGYFMLVNSNLRSLIWVEKVSNIRSLLSFVFLSIKWWVNLFVFLTPRFILLCLCALPFLLYQTYGYFLYCAYDKPFNLLVPSEISMPLLHFGLDHGFVMPLGAKNVSTSSSIPAWCSSMPPFSYTYIQENKWNVGLWSYYQLRQIPNFILAMPVVILCFVCSVLFYRRAPSAYRTLGLYAECEMNRNMVPYVFHMLFLCAYGVLHINVQVLTRMIFSSCPIVYWFCAYLLREAIPNFEQLMKLGVPYSKTKCALYHDLVNICRTMNPFQYRLLKHRAVLCYFVGYAIIGCIMHPNFLPWT